MKDPSLRNFVFVGIDESYIIMYMKKIQKLYIQLYIYILIKFVENYQIVKIKAKKE